MRLLQEGKWVDKWYDTKASNGHFVRKSSQFRNWITTDGAAGPTGSSGFKAEASTCGKLLSRLRSRVQICASLV